MKLFRSQKPKPSASKSAAPQDDTDLSTRIDPFPYTTSIPVVTPIQQRRALASIPPDTRNDAILTVPQSLRARSSSEDPWIVMNDSVANPPMDTSLMENQENVREGSIHSQQEKSWTSKLNLFGGTGAAKDKEKEANAELMRMIGFFTAAAPDDWSFVLEICERASANENAAKEASRALRRGFKYGEPSAQLSAAKLWAIMLQNATNIFILQTASRKFLDILEEVISAEGTSPVVRERLLDVLAAAAYMYGKKPGKEGYMSLWKRVRPTWKPVEGVPFDPQDMLFDSAFPRRGAPPGQLPLPPSQQPQQQAQQPISDRERREDRLRDIERDKYLQKQGQLELSQQQHQDLRSNPTPAISSRRERGIIPPEEDIRKLFEECDVARNNSQILSQALTFASPSTLHVDPVIQEFHNKCRASQELIVAQIPWASAGAERSRVAAAARRAKEPSGDGGANGKLVKKSAKDATSDLTKEVKLLAALLKANGELIEVFRTYEELEKMAVTEMEEREVAKRSMVETKLDRTQIQLISPDGSLIDAPRGQGASSSSRSPSPMPAATRLPPGVTIPVTSVGGPKISGSRDLPLPPSATEHMTPPIVVPANLSPLQHQPQHSPLGPQPQPQPALPSQQRVHHGPNHSLSGYGNLNLPLTAPHGPRPSPDRTGYASTTPPTVVTPSAHEYEYGRPSHPPPQLNAQYAVKADSQNRTELPAPGLAPSGSAAAGGGIYNVTGVQIDMKAAKGYMDFDDEGLMTSIKPSEKARGKRTAFEELPNEEELERREEAELFTRSTAPPDVESTEATPSTHSIYDTAAEMSKELDRIEREEKDGERPRREQTRSSMQRVPGAVEGSSVVASPTLEELMHQKMPEDLTGQVTVPDFSRPAYGGFAAVHKGECNGRTVAIKVLKAKKISKKPARWEASMERRLFREISVWAALSHPNIAEFLGFAEGFGDFSAMISTWCHPGTANDYLYENENITRQGRIRLAQDVAHGLKYLHGLKIIHGDLKPTNILIDDNYVARLCDFGLIRLDDWQGPGGMTTTSPYTGTERYKAPELFISIDNPHPKASSEGDIYALGCITLEFVESRVPYERYNYPYQLIQAIAEGEPPASQNKGQSEDLWYILEACWESDPNDRPKVDQVVDELAKVLSTLT